MSAITDDLFRLASVPVAVLSSSPEGLGFEAVNDAFARLAGGEPGDWRGRPLAAAGELLADVVPDDLEEVAVEGYARDLGECRIVQPGTGAGYVYARNAFPLPGARVGIVAVDVTATRRVERLRELTVEHFMRMPVGGLVVHLRRLGDPDSLTIVAANQRIATLVGRAPDGLVGELFSAVFPGRDWSRLNEMSAGPVAHEVTFEQPGPVPRSRFLAFPLAGRCVGLIVVNDQD